MYVMYCLRRLLLLLLLFLLLILFFVCGSLRHGHGIHGNIKTQSAC